MSNRQPIAVDFEVGGLVCWEEQYLQSSSNDSRLK